MAGHRSGHRRLILLPKRSTPLDIREEEGDGAAGKIGHDPLQKLGWMWFCSIVAWARTGARQRGAPSCDAPYAGVREDGETPVPVSLVTSIDGAGRSARA